jgi:16S rRNA (guanine(1405)-N(7))-methyltransferase
VFLLSDDFAPNGGAKSAFDDWNVVSMSDTLFDKLSSNKKYSDVCPDTIRRAIAECEGRYKKAKDMEKAVREKLHGITSAFNDASGEISRTVASLEYGDEDGLEHVLKMHASTRERLPLSAMDAMYAQIFAATGKPQSVLDLACGLNPVYLVYRMQEDRFPIVGVDVSRSCVTAENIVVASDVKTGPLCRKRRQRGVGVVRRQFIVVNIAHQHHQIRGCS